MLFDRHVVGDYNEFAMRKGIFIINRGELTLTLSLFTLVLLTVGSIVGSYFAKDVGLGSALLARGTVACGQFGCRNNSDCVKSPGLQVLCHVATGECRPQSASQSCPGGGSSRIDKINKNKGKLPIGGPGSPQEVTPTPICVEGDGIGTCPTGSPTPTSDGQSYCSFRATASVNFVNVHGRSIAVPSEVVGWTVENSVGAKGNLSSNGSLSGGGATGQYCCGTDNTETGWRAGKSYKKGVDTARVTLDYNSLKYKIISVFGPSAKRDGNDIYGLPVACIEYTYGWTLTCVDPKDCGDDVTPKPTQSGDYCAFRTTASVNFIDSQGKSIAVPSEVVGWTVENSVGAKGNLSSNGSLSGGGATGQYCCGTDNTETGWRAGKSYKKGVDTARVTLNYNKSKYKIVALTGLHGKRDGDDIVDLPVSCDSYSYGWTLTCVDPVDCQSPTPTQTQTTPTSTEKVISCNQPYSFSGNEGTHTFNVDLGSGTGVVVLDYDAFFAPDRFRMSFENVEVINTGYRGSANMRINPNDPNSETFADMFRRMNLPQIVGDGRGSATFEKKTTSARAIISVDAPLAGTAWSLYLACPVEAETLTPVVGQSCQNQTGVLSGSVTFDQTHIPTQCRGTSQCGVFMYLCDPNNIQGCGPTNSLGRQFVTGPNYSYSFNSLPVNVPVAVIAESSLYASDQTTKLLRGQSAYATSCQSPKTSPRIYMCVVDLSKEPACRASGVNFTLTFLPSGDGKSASEDIKVIFDRNKKNEASKTCKSADLNNDQTVNGIDFVLLLKNLTNLNKQSLYDLNCDGAVNIIDLTLVIKRIGTSTDKKNN